MVGSARACTSGGNCIKIGLPGKSILRDYFQENKTSQRPLLLLRINFPRRPIFIQLVPEWTSGTAAARRIGLTSHSPLGLSLVEMEKSFLGRWGKLNTVMWSLRIHSCSGIGCILSSGWGWWSDTWVGLTLVEMFHSSPRVRFKRLISRSKMCPKMHPRLLQVLELRPNLPQSTFNPIESHPS